MKIKAIIYALLAAIFYSLNVPFSKALLQEVEPSMMAGFLYLGAALGIAILYLLNHKNVKNLERLNKKDLPYTIMMVVLDICAPLLLMFGLLSTSASSASLLNNFEIVATSLIALTFFKEKIRKPLWLGIIFITLASIFLSYEPSETMSFSWGAILVILATLCWGLENNCTRSISDKSTYQIVFIKGLFSGLGSLIVALFLKESFPSFINILKVLALGSVAYGLSIFLYVRAQNVIGAAKTSAYYACAPFIGSLLAYLLLKEQLSSYYFIALFLMLVGTVFVIIDTLKNE